MTAERVAEIQRNLDAVPGGMRAIWYAQAITDLLADRTALRAHIAERCDPDCNGDNAQWDGGFRAACSQVLSLLDGAT